MLTTYVDVGIGVLTNPADALKPPPIGFPIEPVAIARGHLSLVRPSARRKHESGDFESTLSRCVKRKLAVDSESKELRNQSPSIMKVFSVHLKFGVEADSFCGAGWFRSVPVTWFRVEVVFRPSLNADGALAAADTQVRIVVAGTA